MAVDLSSPGARRLFEHWVRGKGAVKIRWGTDGSFDRCVRQLTGKVRDPEGLCAEYHKSATGEWPAEKGVESTVDPLLFNLNAGTRLGWRGLLAPVGKPTGDGREFAAGSLTHRQLPLPLTWQRQTKSGSHDGSVVIGSMQQIVITKDAVAGGGELFTVDQQFMPRLAEDLAEVRFLLEKGVIGPSVELDDHTFAWKENRALITKGRITNATLLPVPAFAEARAFEIFEVTDDGIGQLLLASGSPFDLVLLRQFITLRKWLEQKHPRDWKGRFRDKPDAPGNVRPAHPGRRRAPEGNEVVRPGEKQRQIRRDLERGGDNSELRRDEVDVDEIERRIEEADKRAEAQEEQKRIRLQGAISQARAWSKENEGSIAPLSERASLEVVESVPFSHGDVAETSLVRFSDGSYAVHKNQKEEFVRRSPKELQDAEELTADVAEALGIDHPAVHRINDNEIYMEFVPHPLAVEVWTEEEGEIDWDDEEGAKKRIKPYLETEQGRLLGVMDTIINNDDRHAANWLIDEQGNPIPIDNGMGFFLYGKDNPNNKPREAPFRHGSPFGGYLYDSEGWLDSPFTDADMRKIMDRLIELSPKFQKMGREDWWVDMKTRLGIMREYAAGEENLIS